MNKITTAEQFVELLEILVDTSAISRSDFEAMKALHHRRTTMIYKSP